MSGMPTASETSADARPLFSVLIAAYQAETTIAATLESLRAQSLTDWEAIVVNDGSSDRTLGVVTEYTAVDPRITVISQENRGAGVARNVAAARARGRWLLPLDADDMLLTSALEAQSDFIAAHPGYDLYSWGVLIEDEDGRRFPWPVSAAHNGIEEFTLAQLVEGNLLTAMTAIASATFADLGAFRDVRLEDYDLWLRALASGARHIHNPELLAVYRQSTTSKNADLGPRWLGTAEVLEDLAGMPGVPSHVRAAALKTASYWRARDTRHRLEARLLQGDFTDARSDYVRARPAYQSLAKWLVALPVIVLSPALFVLVTHPSPGEDAANVA